MIAAITLGARLAFSLRNGDEPYMRYGEVSIAEEKADIAREALQNNWLCQVTGRAGV